MISIKDLENQMLSQFETLSTEQAKQQARIGALEAKLEKRIEEMSAEIDKTQSTMAARIFEEGVARIGALAAVEKRIDALEAHIAELEAHIDALGGLMSKIAHPLAAVALKDPLGSVALAASLEDV